VGRRIGHDRVTERIRHGVRWWRRVGLCAIELRKCFELLTWREVHGEARRGEIEIDGQIGRGRLGGVVGRY
jgi:hypothetical protein